jgi:16S rRNA (cytosine1402-N4)-methyltransferase
MMTNNEETYHIPVLLNECLEGLAIQPEGRYVDVTFGGGGHSREIFKQLNEKGHLIGFDQDPDAKANAWQAPNFTFIAGNFAFLKNQLRMFNLMPVDGILADLGVSSHQFDSAERGFSIRMDDELDMRMNQSGPLSAKTVLNEYDEEDLYRVLKSYGEVQGVKRVVETILRERQKGVIATTGQLRNLMAPLAQRGKEHKFLAQIFQAIRIEVNDEMNVLEKMLEQAVEVLKPGGRLVVISYHSLEDRLVKNFMKRGSFDGKIEKDFFGNILKPLEEVNRKPILPNEEELARNSRSRSAKLRIAVKLDNGK